MTGPSPLRGSLIRPALRAIAAALLVAGCGLAPGFGATPVPTLEPTPATFPATFGLESHGAIETTVTLEATCGAHGQDIGIEGTDGRVTVQLGVGAGGTITHLSVSTAEFLAFTGKGFELTPPWVVPDAGSDALGGTVRFRELPNAIGSGSISGSVTWRCELSGPPG
jgi:hypothetical protein